jgi:putative transposase
MRLFHKARDYAAFEHVLTEGSARYPVELLIYCVMPNHWQFGRASANGRGLGAVDGLGGRDACAGTTNTTTAVGGHLYQGRFKSFPVAEEDYFLALCRCVEANPLRAEFVKRVEQWQWSGLWRRFHGSEGLHLSEWPVAQPRNWVARVNRELNEEQLEGIRSCVQRGRPLGTEPWGQQTADRLGLRFTLWGPDRPRTLVDNQ